jgi:hypothetical protein
MVSSRHFGVIHTLSYILKDIVDEMKLFIHPSILSSVPLSIHGWHHIIILYNVKAEKLL